MNPCEMFPDILAKLDKLSEDDCKFWEEHVAQCHRCTELSSSALVTEFSNRLPKQNPPAASLDRILREMPSRKHSKPLIPLSIAALLIIGFTLYFTWPRQEVELIKVVSGNLTVTKSSVSADKGQQGIIQVFGDKIEFSENTRATMRKQGEGYIISILNGLVKVIARKRAELQYEAKGTLVSIDDQAELDINVGEDSARVTILIGDVTIRNNQKSVSATAGDRAAISKGEITLNRGSRMAFVRDSHLWVINADGSCERQLTRGVTLVQPLSWSPDGKRILFVAKDNARNDIYVMKSNGTGLKNLTRPLPAPYQVGDWTFDGKVVVCVPSIDRMTVLYVVDPDAGASQELARLADSLTGGYGGRTIAITLIRVSPDAKKVLFCRQTTDGDELFVVTIDGGTPDLVVKGKLILPKWLPNSKDIITTCDGAIYRIDSETKNKTTVMAGGKPGRSEPVYQIGSWSPESKNIVYADDRGEGYHIYFTDLETKEETRLTSHSEEIKPAGCQSFSIWLQWSPTHLIAVARGYRSDRSEDVKEILLIDTKSRNIKTLTKGSTPIWAPWF